MASKYIGTDLHPYRVHFPFSFNWFARQQPIWSFFVIISTKHCTFLTNLYMNTTQSNQVNILVWYKEDPFENLQRNSTWELLSVSFNSPVIPEVILGDSRSPEELPKNFWGLLVQNGFRATHLPSNEQSKHQRDRNSTCKENKSWKIL